jgi:hypothetical protein
LVERIEALVCLRAAMQAPVLFGCGGSHGQKTRSDGYELRTRINVFKISEY